MEKQNGKGSKPRPYSVGWEQFSKNWDSIFINRDTSTKMKKEKQQ